MMRSAKAAMLFMAASFLALNAAFAIEPDGPHIDHAKRNAEAWAAENADIDAKLAALEQRLGRSRTSSIS